MSNLKEQVNKTAYLLNDIKSALEDQGIDTSNLTPMEYADAVRGIVNNITVENVGLLPIIIFKYSAERPSTPSGGSWNPLTNEMVLPDGWYSDIDVHFNMAERLLPLWMSIAIFSNQGGLYKKWNTPVRISGRDGVDGKRGEAGLPGTIAGITQFFNIPIFYRGNSVQPDTPQASYDIDDNVLTFSPQGWSETISDDYNDGDVYWQSYVKYNSANNPPAACTVPVRVTAESSVVKGNNRYYQLSNLKETPSKGTSNWKLWTEDINIAPTRSQNYLYCYDETVYSESNKTTTPVYLLAIYTKGLLDIDVAYTVGLEDTIKDTEYDDQFWFANSTDALSVDKNLPAHPDDDEYTYYPGLNERTIYLWCRERFRYEDGVNEDFYRIISYYKAAEKAPVLYSAGVYNEKTLYQVNEEQCPYIFYPVGLYLDDSENVITKVEDGVTVPVTDKDNPTEGKKYQYFFLKKSYEPQMEYDNFYQSYVNHHWKKIDSFEAIYSDIGIFKSALVGKFVFDDKYMFSMFGKGFVNNNSSGTIKMEYTNFTDTKGKIWDDSENTWKTRDGVATAIDAAVCGAEANKKFIPGTLINAVTGESWFANGNTRFYYDGEGDLAGGAIAWRYDNNESENPTLYIDGDVKIGQRANKHEYGSSSPINAKSFNQIISDQETIKKTVEKVQDQIDGVVENWNGEKSPILSNEPYSSWTNGVEGEEKDAVLIAHINDTYINIGAYDETNNPTAGHAWRWCECTDSSITNYVEVKDSEGKTLKLHWHEIADSDAVRALKEAAEATRIAEGAVRLNLLANSKEVVSSSSIGGSRHKSFTLPITVNAGEQYTFKCEKSSVIDGVDTFYTVGLCDENGTWISTFKPLAWGENNVATIVVKNSINGVAPQNIRANLFLYRDTDNTTYTGARFENLSLVKGKTPMADWQDYQGDNGLKNLIEQDEDGFTYSVEASNTVFAGHVLKFKNLSIRKGEIFTFAWDSIKFLDKVSQVHAYLYYYPETNKEVGIASFTLSKFNYTDFGWRSFPPAAVDAIAANAPSGNIYIKIYPRSESSNNVNLYDAGVEMKNISLVKGSRPMMVWKSGKKSDYEYLADTFGTVTDIDGVSLSKAVAVKDNNGKVTGILNGTNEWTNDKGASLILAAGADGASNINTASTRIYADGTGYFTGAINATGLYLDFGKIDHNFTINGGAFTQSQNSYLFASGGKLVVRKVISGNVWNSGNDTIISAGEISLPKGGASTYGVHGTTIKSQSYEIVKEDYKIYVTPEQITVKCDSDNEKKTEIKGGVISCTRNTAKTEINEGTISCTGTIDCNKLKATNGVFDTSDARLKDFENKIEVDLDVIKNIPKMYFRWKDNPENLNIGTSAQEVQKIYPELVSANDNGELSVSYSKLSIIALAAIDKLHEENIELKNRLTKLEELYGNRN